MRKNNSELVYSQFIKIFVDTLTEGLFFKSRNLLQTLMIIFVSPTCYFDIYDFILHKAMVFITQNVPTYCE